ncbi:hypothetical protein, conserved [Eimeria maxima]|uniref:C2HC/C3H-type domain-containing protein n=1 Tax=Eimeria maxima TaxID=5804 RepID=U6M0I3_EIMMA|nr:hypothetical protein, conserved [Eimeria maxima]CDJ55969.1 hypothetical protein, conserved [Eimeria maxima]
MSRPPIFESSSGSVTRGGEEEEHEFLCAEQTAKVSTPHSEGNELLNEARVATRTASFGAVGIATPSCPEGNSGRSPKRSDNFGWPHGPQLPAAWGHGEFQALVAGMKSEHEAPEIERQKTSKEAGQTAPCPSGQPALDTTLSLETKRSSEALGKMPGQKYAPTSSKESPRAVASYPWTHEDTGEKPEFLASRGTFAQAIPQGGYLLDTFLSGSHPSQNESLPVEANNGDEPQEIQECPYCHRTFASKSFDKHVKVCVKVFFTRRKQYDMTRKRLASVVEEAGLPVHSTVQKLRGELSSKP